MKLKKDDLSIERDIKYLNMYRIGRIEFNKLKYLISINNNVVLSDDDIKKLIKLGYERYTDKIEE